MRRSQLIPVILMMSLTGCSAGIFKDGLRIEAVSCPTLIRYGEEYQRHAADELRRIEKTSPHIARLVVDYSKIRDQIRVCRGAP